MLTYSQRHGQSRTMVLPLVRTPFLGALYNTKKTHPTISHIDLHLNAGLAAVFVEDQPDIMTGVKPTGKVEITVTHRTIC